MANGDQEERREGITLTKGTTVTLSLAMLLSAAGVVYSLGRQSEKLDAVAITVSQIQAVQYTQRDAERDLSPIRRDNERFDVRLRGVEQVVNVRPQGR